MKVITPKPRKAKNVSATLDTMSRTGGYPEKARRSRSMLASVDTANTVRMPITTMTTTVWARATTCEPSTLRNDMTTTTSTAKALTHPVSPSATALLA